MLRDEFQGESRMHDFYYDKKGDLCCEKVPLKKILKKTGTPAYIYSSRTISEHLAKI